MTLQQKLIAKQSKKGFTLVELVVVIAILAILAAIAIPSIIGIIGSASTSAGQTEAAELSSACKTFYAGVKSGTILDTSLNADGTSVGSIAATSTDSAATRTSKAKSATIAAAAKYSGLTPNYDDFYAYTATGASSAGEAQGTIIFDDSGSTPAGTFKIAGTTTLGPVGATAGLYAA